MKFQKIIRLQGVNIISNKYEALIALPIMVTLREKYQVKTVEKFRKVLFEILHKCL